MNVWSVFLVRICRNMNVRKSTFTCSLYSVLFFSNMPEIIHGLCWRTGCSKEYLDLRGMNWQEASGSCVMRSFVICTHNPIVIRMMKSKRMRWAGHVARMEM
jgi:hypothetical protein